MRNHFKFFPQIWLDTICRIEKNLLYFVNVMCILHPIISYPCQPLGLQHCYNIQSKGIENYMWISEMVFYGFKTTTSETIASLPRWSQALERSEFYWKSSGKRTFWPSAHFCSSLPDQLFPVLIGKAIPFKMTMASVHALARNSKITTHVTNDYWQTVDTICYINLQHKYTLKHNTNDWRHNT